MDNSEITDLMNLTSLLSHHIMDKQCKSQNLNSKFNLITEILDTNANILETAISFLRVIQNLLKLQQIDFPQSS